MADNVEKRTVSMRVASSINIEGKLNIPDDPKALVIFSHGSGSSRFSPRNVFVAEKLNKQNIATLLIDLLTSEGFYLREPIQYRLAYRSPDRGDGKDAGVP
jgi:hypothetical protein